MPLYIQIVKEAPLCFQHEEVSYLYHFTHVVRSSIFTQTTATASSTLTKSTLISASTLNYSPIDFQFTTLLLSAVIRRQATDDMMEIPNRAYHENHMRAALAMAEYAITNDETPVGCVFVHNGEIVARGINDTNKSMNGTRHAEFQAISQLLLEQPDFPFHEADLYVTVEPCIMCASTLRQFGIRAVYFGCNNDKFGGCGGVLSINDDPSVDPGYPAYGGIFREEAIMLLRRFYVQENEKAPEPKMKKNRVLKFEIQPVVAKEGQSSVDMKDSGSSTKSSESFD